MKRKFGKIASCLMMTLLLASLTACGGTTQPEDSAEGATQEIVEIPAEVQAVKDKVTTMAEDYAKELDGEWADKHTALLESGEAREFAGYAELLDVLTKIQEESGAYYVYTLITDSPDAPEYQITVDASPEPDEWMDGYEWEAQFKEAIEGSPAAARSAWDDSQDDLCWSAFAPIHNSAGEIVAILGIDYPAPEILDFPEWNRDNEQWNGITE